MIPDSFRMHATVDLPEPNIPVSPIVMSIHPLRDDAVSGEFQLLSNSEHAEDVPFDPVEFECRHTGMLRFNSYEGFVREFPL